MTKHALMTHNPQIINNPGGTWGGVSLGGSRQTERSVQQVSLCSRPSPRPGGTGRHWLRAGWAGRQADRLAAAARRRRRHGRLRPTRVAAKKLPHDPVFVPSRKENRNKKERRKKKKKIEVNPKSQYLRRACVRFLFGPFQPLQGLFVNEANRKKGKPHAAFSQRQLPTLEYSPNGHPWPHTVCAGERGARGASQLVGFATASCVCLA